ncbi:MAG: tRNA uridine-5-carboxymethylaminomethyl(34) synthesis GTPase MnmE [Prevotella sp.]|nr:tRNA uridine-5-carboxymethylaminomethyl(34) synthesis GTPase MnmE [Prevotella sp.]
MPSAANDDRISGKVCANESPKHLRDRVQPKLDEANSTICAIATAQGGAIGIVRVSGPDAIAIAEGIFRGKRKVKDAKPYSILYGRIVDGEETVDEVLVAIFRAPHSYTGEDSVEISCHASPYILTCIISLLIHHGCRMAEPGEFTKRAFLNGKMDLSQAEAVADLIASETRAQHRMAMNQMRGGYSEKLRSLRDKLLHMTSLLELELDFSEEDIEFAKREELVSLAEDIRSETSRLTGSFRQGDAIKKGVPVAILGASNVGKSTLLNALLGDDRSIVSDCQGTTRDVIEDTTTIDGIQFRFIDTAGIRHTDDKVEQMGIERSFRAAEKAMIIILLTSPGVDYPDIPIRDGQTVIRIVNKTDSFQALTGRGLEELKNQLVGAVKPAGSEILVTNLRHYQALCLAQTDIERAQSGLSAALSADIVAEDLRQCLAHLGEILGDITTEEVLNNIFSHFCIGK